MTGDCNIDSIINLPSFSSSFPPSPEISRPLHLPSWIKSPQQCIALTFFFCPRRLNPRRDRRRFKIVAEPSFFRQRPGLPGFPGGSLSCWPSVVRRTANGQADEIRPQERRSGGQRENGRRKLKMISFSNQ